MNYASLKRPSNAAIDNLSNILPFLRCLRRDGRLFFAHSLPAQQLNWQLRQCLSWKRLFENRQIRFEFENILGGGGGKKRKLEYEERKRCAVSGGRRRGIIPDFGEPYVGDRRRGMGTRRERIAVLEKRAPVLLVPATVGSA
uniref:Uncharacterized protein n=1 Tax=Ananas comosus var. bracteatus TaxID=296719 RepID=A0A6V7P855_ANACO|nr:unnamed protein product [Ananas comosus var. bracteatus]